METKKLLLIAIFFFSIYSFAQSNIEDKKEQIKAMKVGFITNELALTTEEAAKFWPIYNAYDDKQFEIKHQKMKAFRNRMDSDFSKMNEKESSLLLSQMECSEDELYHLRKKFISNLKCILPSVKIIKLKKAEDDFNKKLLQQYRDKGRK